MSNAISNISPDLDSMRSNDVIPASESSAVHSPADSAIIKRPIGSNSDLVGPNTSPEIPENYLLTENGVFLKGTPPKLLADPIWISALTIDAQTEIYGVAICWIDLKRNKHKKVFNRALLFEQGNKIIMELAALGLSINHERPSLLKTYLVESSNINKRFIDSSSNLGWFSTDKAPNQLTYI